MYDREMTEKTYVNARICFIFMVISWHCQKMVPILGRISQFPFWEGSSGQKGGLAGHLSALLVDFYSFCHFKIFSYMLLQTNIEKAVSHQPLRWNDTLEIAKVPNECAEPLCISGARDEPGL